MTSTPFVPHHDRHPFHGITVVVDTPARVFVGRLDTADDVEVVLKDVGYHDDIATREDYLSRTAKYGVKRLTGVVTLPTASAVSIRPLAEVVG